MKKSIKIIILLFSFIMALTMAVSVSASESIQSDEYDILLSSLGITNTTGMLSTSEITTTDGSPIETEEKEELKYDDDALAQIDFFVSLCEVIDEVAPPSNIYNSHSYAWYQRNRYNEYYITSPEPFIGDIHCDQIYDLDDVTVGDIIAYPSGSDYLHSAVIYDIAYENGEIVFYCKSKWDALGVYKHRWDKLPESAYVPGEDGKPIVEYYRYYQGEHETTYTSVDSYRHVIGCGRCEYTEYVAHDNRCITVSSSRHQYICRDCGYSRYESHTPQYTEYSDQEHTVRCSGCGYTVYEDHDIYISEVYNHVYTIKCSECTYEISCNCDREYEADGDMGHYVECMDGCFSEFESHTYEQTGEYDSSSHEIECVYCYYSEYVDHDLYMYSAETEDYTVKCRDCNYSVRCVECPEYYGTDGTGHWVDCPDGCYSFFEAHTYKYTDTGNGTHAVTCADCGYTYTAQHLLYRTESETENSFAHIVKCTICDYESTESHTWVSSGLVYRCTVCGMISDSAPGIMSLPDPELEAYLASLTDEEREEFIASLPEDQVARVTALLPNDDEYVTE